MANNLLAPSPGRRSAFVLASCLALLLLGERPASACHHHDDYDDDGDLSVEMIASFSAEDCETPENIAIDSHGTIFVTLALTGEIRRISPSGAQSTFATLKTGDYPGQPCGSFVGGLTGLTIDEDDTLYAALASCDPTKRGIWRINKYGNKKLLATLPMEALPNGLTYRNGKLYVADSTLGVIWQADAGAPGTAKRWLEDPRLAPAMPGYPGANGVQFFDDELYVSNSSAQQILAVKVKSTGKPGAIRVHAEGAFCDDFAFDRYGAIYCGTDPFNTLVRFAPDGSMDVLLTAEDGLDGTTSVIFGRGWGDRSDVYVTNASFPFFPSSAGTPSVMKVRLGVLGEPRL